MMTVCGGGRGTCCALRFVLRKGKISLSSQHKLEERCGKAKHHRTHTNTVIAARDATCDSAPHRCYQFSFNLNFDGATLTHLGKQFANSSPFRGKVLLCNLNFETFFISNIAGDCEKTELKRATTFALLRGETSRRFLLWILGSLETFKS